MADPVIFYMPDGTPFSNDPVWQAQQLLDPGEREQEGESDTDSDVDPYEGLTGAELKTLAAERGVDIAGLRKVGEVRDALRAADAAEADEETDSEE